jgi:hypothetical protein
MNLPKDILSNVFSFLDWIEFYKVIKYFKYDIPQQLIRYSKSNNSLTKITIDNMCANRIEYLELVEFLYSVNAKCSTNAIAWASMNGHLETIKYLHSIGKQCHYTHALALARAQKHFKVVIFLHSIALM